MCCMHVDDLMEDFEVTGTKKYKTQSLWRLFNLAQSISVITQHIKLIKALTNVSFQ